MFLITFLINFYVWVSDDLCMLRTCCVVEKWSFWCIHRKWSFWPLLDTPLGCLLSDTHKSCRWVVDQLLIKNWSKTDHFWIWSICHVFDHFFNQLLCMSFRWFVHVAYMLRCGKVVILTCASDVSFWHIEIVFLKTCSRTLRLNDAGRALSLILKIGLWIVDRKLIKNMIFSFFDQLLTKLKKSIFTSL